MSIKTNKTGKIEPKKKEATADDELYTRSFLNHIERAASYYAPYTTTIAEATFSAKPRPTILKGPEYDPDEEEHQEYMTSELNSPKFNNTSDADGFIGRIKKKFNRSKELGDSTLLALIKVGIISSDTNMLYYDEHLRRHGADAARDQLSRNKRSFFMELGMYHLDISQEEQNKLGADLDEFVIFNGHKLDYFYVEFSETFFDLLDVCIKKGIKIDQEVLNLKNTDFKILRSQNKCINLCYIYPLNTLVLISDDYDFTSSDGQFNKFCQEMNKKPDREVLKMNLPDPIVINGKEYSRMIFESVVDTDFDLFLKNLELETYLNAE